ncbi:CapA family protein [Pontibacter sp. HSC-36F09]|uniref:CapA family protein n=1 Tax=Pontibacter sp. HSC-36F09 TaxID=2910966 RepID=UPI0020A0A607|nr:CapA family protein [Pontibacter sp. HSC-36F09]MCP2044258.1 poly-gamma-glutamate synthesis protein (capsule biosynthesis protein) [Pontibacter sp. HSC-36F09]
MRNNQAIDILITGDICIRYRAKSLLDEGRGNEIADITQFSDVDYKLTNLEAPLVDDGYPLLKTGPSLKNPTSSLNLIKSMGFNLLCLANNHIMDYGCEGLNNTIKLCELEGIPFIGAGANSNKASTPFFINKAGQKIAIINIAENEFGEATIDSPGFYAYEAINAYNSIREIKGTVDHVVVVFHGGHEHHQLPSPEIQKRYRFLIDSGASVVVAHHTHCFSGYEKYNGGLISYSLGNFIFDHPKKRNDIWNYGYALKLTFETGFEPNFEIYPYSQCDKEAKVVFLEGEEKKIFFNKISEINSVILNEERLTNEWRKYLEVNYKKYLTYLEVPNYKYLRGARLYKLLPSFISKTHKALLLNMVRCDSHNEIFKFALKKSVFK